MFKVLPRGILSALLSLAVIRSGHTADAAGAWIRVKSAAPVVDTAVPTISPGSGYTGVSSSVKPAMPGRSAWQ